MDAADLIWNRAAPPGPATGRLLGMRIRGRGRPYHRQPAQALPFPVRYQARLQQLESYLLAGEDADDPVEDGPAFAADSQGEFLLHAACCWDGIEQAGARAAAPSRVA
jgi:hypothetical protein